MEKPATVEKIKIDEKKIKRNAYINNENIEEVELSNAVTCIEEGAFSGCKNLRKINLPDSITYIGPRAFSGCENLEEVILPKNLKTIHFRAFADCKRLKKIVLPERLKKIEWAVLSGCENLTEVVLPDSVTLDESHQLFLNCKRLKKVTLPNPITTLPSECFKGCHQLDIKLSKNIVELKDRTFEDCYKLSAFPETVTSFGKNCFRNCRKLESVTLNNSVTQLADGMFDGCINLKEISYSNNEPLAIGKKCFRNCTSLKEIPDFVKDYSPQAFENCTGLTSIQITDSNIPFACFRGCTNLHTIEGQEKIFDLNSFAFSGCTSLESFEIHHETMIPAEAFSNCKNLKTVILNIGTTSIGSRAFYNCTSLTNIPLPDLIENISKGAFQHCSSIKEITIPGNLKTLGEAALSYMSSLESIQVSPFNKTFATPDGKILIHNVMQKVMVYAQGCKDKSYSFKDYNFQIDILNREVIRSIDGIGEYAFAGCKNLEELTVCACTKNIESTAFKDCENLKKLNVVAISLYTCPGFDIRDHGRYYFKKADGEGPYLPFETVEFSGELVQIWTNALQYFKNVKKLIFPSDRPFSIGDRAFVDCKLLEEVQIPKNVHEIYQYAFAKTTKVTFENGISETGFISLVENTEYTHSYNLYTIENEKYYIEQDGNLTKLTGKQIDEVCTHSEKIRKYPVLYLDFMNDLITHDLVVRDLLNGILFTHLSLENRDILLNNLDKKDTQFFKVLKHSELLEEYDSLTKFLLEEDHFKNVFQFMEYLKENHIKDKFLMNKLYMCIAHHEDAPLFFMYYDANMKRLLKESKIQESPDSSLQNLEDLLVLLKITGGLEENEITRQKAQTYITEKIFAKNVANGKKNEYRIAGDDIHRIFNFPQTRAKYNPEFAQFFMENYQELLTEERSKSGFIERVYINFVEISRTHTSNKGSQRKLKVTMKKCKDYLRTIKFNHVESEEKDLAERLGAWYSSQDTWEKAKRICKESLHAPRNIFTEVMYDEDGNPIYDNNPDLDLREKSNENFSFEWLPKQDYDNLILGKYCNCCAHVEGVGNGIMRASMILDNCQNLVVRSGYGAIIAKSTMYVNKEQGYAVLNNIEASLNYNEKEDIEKIYHAILRGASAFVEVYNQNNPQIPITKISIGASRKQISEFLTDENHPKIDILPALYYGEYSLSRNGYNGDCHNTQRLLIKK